MDSTPSTRLGTYVEFYRRRWPIAILVAVAYFALMWLSEAFLPHPGTLFPAAAVALSALFLEGLELWPVVYLAALAGSFLAHYPTEFLIVMPVAQTLQATAGAYVLQRVKIDPLFRRLRDIFWLLSVVALVALVVPALGSFANAVGAAITGVAFPIASWGLRYTGTLFCLLVLTPFLLRWFAKTRFSRTRMEVLETLGIFVLLVGIDYFAFIKGFGTLAGIPTVYFLLVPLFWIALRLRPRFVTLALLVTSVFAIASVYLANLPTPELFTEHLFGIEEFIIVLAAIFLVVVSLEENRRLNSNLILSQVAALENAVARVSSESKAKNDFLAVLAHELRNPLAPVMSGIELMKLAEGRAEDETETLALMEDRMQAVRRLLDDLLDISRITEGKLTLKKESVDLEKIIRSAIVSTAHYVKERHQSLAFDAPPGPLLVWGDPVRLEQVFSNLLTNASKYSNSGDQIRIRMRAVGAQAEIVVSDTGVGIRPEALEEIFTPFHQIDLGSRTSKGLGIGLALVRSFVERHEGTVTAASEGGGKGSRFTVLLPRMRDALPAPAPYEPKRGSTPPKPAKIRVLIVDDLDTVAWSMGRLLELKGCSVTYAYDGGQAIEEALSAVPDVVLLDVGLPDMDGYAVAKTLRARGFRGRVIALTGYSTEDARTRGAEVGFDQYLVKPAGLADLKRAIPELA